VTGNSFSAVILAGGESRRMGRDKAWVEFKGKTLIQMGMEKLHALGIQEIFISGRASDDYSAYEYPVLLDLEPGFGPLGGIERGLQACAKPLLLVLAVDLPLMTPAFLEKLCARCDDSIGIVPELDGRLEPLAAVYPKRCHTLASETLFTSRPAVQDFVGACLKARAVRSYSVPAAEATLFFNWNSPADLPDSC